MENTLTEMLSASGGMTDFLQSLVYFMQGGCFVFTLMGGIQLCTFEPDNRLKRFLSTIFFLCAGMYLKDIIIYQSAFFNFAPLYRVSISIDYWLVPFCVMFVLELLNPGWVNRRMVICHLFPFLLYTLLVVFVPADEVIWMGMLLTAIYGIGNIIFIIPRIRDYEQVMMQEYSNTERVGIGWIKFVFFCFIVYLALWLCASLQKNPCVDVLYYLFSLLLWFLILFKGYKQEVIFSGVNGKDEMNREQDEMFLQTGYWEFAFAQTGETPDEAIRKRQLFLNPCIRLSEVAVELNTNRTYLSNYLNRVQKTSFLDYINRLRLEYACTLLSDPANHDTLEVISEKSGFNSFSTFYRSFVKAYSTTPGKFRTGKNEQSGAHTG